MDADSEEMAEVRDGNGDPGSGELLEPDGNSLPQGDAVQTASLETEEAGGIPAQTDGTKPGKVSRKDVRDIPRKKLPGMLRRSYSGWALENMLIRRVYIPEDKEFLRSLFVQGSDVKKPGRYAVPSDALFTRRELARCKGLVKSINSHRGIVRLVPLAATVILVIAAAAVVIVFKNRIAKKAVVAVCQKVFKAVTDVESVELEILGSSLTIRNIQVGNRNSVMKNLFEARTIQIDFNLTEALRGRFDAENLEASGLAFGTDRTYSCYIPGSDTTLAEKIEDSPFMQSLQRRSSEALEELYTEVTDVLGGDDVDAIVENVQKQLKTPTMFVDTMAFGEGLFNKWSAKPGELKAQVDSFAATIQELQTLQIQATFDADILRSNLTKVNNALVASRSIKDTAVALVEEVKDDASAVQAQAQAFIAAAEADVQFATDRLTSIKNIADNSLVIFTDALDSVGYDVMGKYYPYAKQALAYAQELKESTAVEKPKKEEKKTVDRKRMEGTTFWFRPDKPSFLVERAYVSGTGFSGTLAEVTNDQNVRGIPTSLDVSFLVTDVSNDIRATLDMRRGTKAPLVAVDYTGSGFKAAIDGTGIATKSGVPSINGTAVIKLSGSGGNNQFSAGGSIDLNPVSLTSDGFENALITRYYQTALGAVSRINMGIDAGYNDARGVWLNLDGNFAEQFSAALYAVVQTIGMDAKNFALKKIQDEINNSQNEVLLQVKNFLGIEGDIDLQNFRISDLQTLLEAKRVEIENQLKKVAADAMLDGVRQTFGEDDDVAADAAATLLQKWGF